MFAVSVFESNLDLANATISTLVIGFVFFKMVFSYTQKRTNRHYAQGKSPAPSIASFKQLSKILFVTSMLLTLSSYWLRSPLFLALYEQTAIQFIGALLVLFGYLNLNRAFTHLGDNYSPLFDAHLPTTLITTGVYRLIRHPIYLFNLCVSFGLAISSGSGIVTINAIIGLFFILQTIAIEETYLKQHFADYQVYSKKSWRLLPFIY